MKLLYLQVGNHSVSANHISVGLTWKRSQVLYQAQFVRIGAGYL